MPYLSNTIELEDFYIIARVLAINVQVSEAVKWKEYITLAEHGWIYK